MDEAARLVAELRNAVDGDPWYGLSMVALLDGVDGVSAAALVPGVRHSIWEVVLHTAGWAREAARRFGGGEGRRMPELGNWPMPETSDEEAWAEAKRYLLDAHREAEDAILALGDGIGLPHDAAVDAKGTLVTYARMAAGLASHVAYHAGQISIIKQGLGIAPPPED